LDEVDVCLEEIRVRDMKPMLAYRASANPQISKEDVAGV